MSVASIPPISFMSERTSAGSSVTPSKITRRLVGSRSSLLTSTIVVPSARAAFFTSSRIKAFGILAKTIGSEASLFSSVNAALTSKLPGSE